MKVPYFTQQVATSPSAVSDDLSDKMCFCLFVLASVESAKLGLHEEWVLFHLVCNQSCLLNINPFILMHVTLISVALCIRAKFQEFGLNRWN